MKHFIAGFLMACLALVAMGAAVRESLYREFGPKLIEAVVQVCKDEFNRNREWHNEPRITNEQMAAALQAKLNTIDDYSWMTNSFGAAE
jgi:hypothetical protein